MTAQSAHKVGNDYRTTSRSENNRILRLPRLFWISLSLSASYIISQTYLILVK